MFSTLRQRNVSDHMLLSSSNIHRAEGIMTHGLPELLRSNRNITFTFNEALMRVIFSVKSLHVSSAWVWMDRMAAFRTDFLWKQLKHLPTVLTSHLNSCRLSAASEMIPTCQSSGSFWQLAFPQKCWLSFQLRGAQSSQWDWKLLYCRPLISYSVLK